MNKKTITLNFVAFLSTLIITANSRAEGISFVPRVWSGAFYYSLKQSSLIRQSDGMVFPEIKFDGSHLMYGLGLSSIYDRYYLDFSFQKSEKIEKDQQIPNGGVESINGYRKDYSATFGMRVLDNNGNVYFGYKKGDTSADTKFDSSYSFKENGFFIGASYNWIILNKGLLAINAAYADMDGQVKTETGPNIPVSLNLDLDARTKGVSYGISWNSNISRRMGYSVSFDVNDYTFDSLKSNTDNIKLSGNIDEIYYIGKISINYQF